MELRSPPGSCGPVRLFGFSGVRSRSPQGAPIAVLAGLAGSGKTELLGALARAGDQVLDLEGLASHRGSAFGGIGLPPQPAHDEFQRLVEERLAAADPDRVLWVEDEGPFIGSVGVPSGLQDAIARAPVVAVRASRAARVQRLTVTYGTADRSALVAALEGMRRRLGAAPAARASALVRSGDVRAAVELVLPHFDAAYRHRMSMYRRPLLGHVEMGPGPARATGRSRSREVQELARLVAPTRLQP